MSKRVGMHTFLETGTLRRMIASVPDGFAADGLRGGMPAVTGEKPDFRLEPTPVLA